VHPTPRFRAGGVQIRRSYGGNNKVVIDEAELRRLSQAERWQLARMLTELDGPGPAEQASPDPYLRDPKLGRQRRLVLFISAGCCVILAVWIVVLAATLPHHFNTHHWRALWVRFDVLLLAAFAATAWATWKKRQILILLLMLTGTMLCCDAWFDVGTSLGTSSAWLSIADAAFAELPLAFLAFTGARRLLKATVEAGMPVPAGDQSQDRREAAEEQGRGGAPSLRRTPLAGAGLEEAFPGGRALERAERSRQSTARGPGAE
jgi:hypothetical protein